MLNGIMVARKTKGDSCPASSMAMPAANPIASKNHMVDLEDMRLLKRIYSSGPKSEVNALTAKKMLKVVGNSPKKSS